MNKHLCISPLDHLALAKWHLDQAIAADLSARQVSQLGKLGAARYEIAEALAIREQEVGRDAAAGRTA